MASSSGARVTGLPEQRRLRAATLVVWGAEDTLIPAAHAEAYAWEIPRAELVEVPNAAHLIAVERPQELAAIVTDFLAD